MNIQGKCIVVCEPLRFISKRNGEEFVKTTFVVETSGQYANKVAFTVVGSDRFARMGVVVGGSYDVSFDVESREWNGKWFTDLVAWRVAALDGANAAATVAQAEQPSVMPANVDDGTPF